MMSDPVRDDEVTSGVAHQDEQWHVVMSNPPIDEELN
jgi:23S rRNA A1618 N6-methylase RlmF